MPEKNPRELKSTVPGKSSKIKKQPDARDLRQSSPPRLLVQIKASKKNTLKKKKKTFTTLLLLLVRH